MSLFLLNIILAIAWAALTGTFTLAGLGVGLVVGFFALWVASPLFEENGGRYFTRVWRWIKLVVLFHYELIVSSLSVAWDVLTPRHRARPGIVAVPLKAKGEAEVLLVTNLISLTPGTLSLDVTEDCNTLFVHAMFADDPQKIRDDIENGMERWVREAME
ncbi:Na+/H+ antiporter subunit E [Jannaschia seohaensis]|uniref:Multicomponent Na+:H+ antiporter subunit E n=1 Tax=Jannaschia seohaensis TaxID=475081 RepID=A0A2Y9C932_9RHOB|nr:Na+/H+ antiporter subunit E [Jannaschia seohaensis]PWJ12080.1 multicomponent Na+:H+ antiporter subunit E [Jannaschia seohaensis]SSA51183.1 multicomponent Na+:H+ antiporter subunit E [Jannaschia seohaensis]